MKKSSIGGVYIAEFSNGITKIGMSNNGEKGVISRIKSAESNMKTRGVSLVKSGFVLCHNFKKLEREAIKISKTCDSAWGREWFHGVDYDTVLLFFIENAVTLPDEEIAKIKANVDAAYQRITRQIIGGIERNFGNKIEFLPSNRLSAVECIFAESEFLSGDYFLKDENGFSVFRIFANIYLSNCDPTQFISLINDISDIDNRDFLCEIAAEIITNGKEINSINGAE